MSGAVPIAQFVKTEGDNVKSLHLLIDGMHCPSCVAIIEGALKKEPEITNARLNLSTKRLNINWQGAVELGEKWVSLINGMGYKAAAFDPETSETAEKKEERLLLRCLAVAGFASGNLMLFSVPLWSSDAIEMGSAATPGHQPNPEVRVMVWITRPGLVRPRPYGSDW